MLKKLLLLFALSVSFETQPIPSVGKVWGKAKQGLKNTISAYPKAIASFYLIRALIELHKSYFLVLHTTIGRPNFNYSKSMFFVPKTVYEALTLKSRNEIDREIWSQSRDFDFIRSEILPVAKQVCFLCFKEDMASFIKWVLGSFATDYILANSENPQA